MEVWKCPACFADVGAAGPALLKLAIAEHIRAHERAACRAGLSECGVECAKHMSTDRFCAARNFGVRGMLTAYDEQFLAGIRVRWHTPIVSDDTKK